MRPLLRRLRKHLQAYFLAKALFKLWIQEISEGTFFGKTP